MIFRARWVSGTNPGNSKMQSISKNIRKGALAFLNAEYRLLLVFVILASIGLYFLSKSIDTTSWLIIPAFIVGAVFSGFAGNIGMRMATKANTRTAQAAKSSLSKALNISFGGGTVMGLGVAGLAVLGLSLFLLLFIENTIRSY